MFQKNFLDKNFDQICGAFLLDLRRSDRLKTFLMDSPHKSELVQAHIFLLMLNELKPVRTLSLISEGGVTANSHPPPTKGCLLQPHFKLCNISDS